jgi:hypothetical protein
VEPIFGSKPDTDIRSAVDAIGKEELTRQIAGTSDKHSKEWRNARDYVSRHLRGSRRNVGSPKIASIVGNANREAKKREILNRGSLSVTMEVTISVSDKGRPWKGKIQTRNPLTGSDLTRYMNALDNGNYQAAINTVADSYGIHHDIASVNKIKSVRYE